MGFLKKMKAKLEDLNGFLNKTKKQKEGRMQSMNYIAVTILTVLRKQRMFTIRLFHFSIKIKNQNKIRKFKREHNTFLQEAQELYKEQRPQKTSFAIG